MLAVTDVKQCQCWQCYDDDETGSDTVMPVSTMTLTSPTMLCCWQCHDTSAGSDAVTLALVMILWQQCCDAVVGHDAVVPEVMVMSH